MRLDTVVGRFHLFEALFGFGFFMRADIGVILARELAKGFLDRFLPGADFDLQRQVCGADLFGRRNIKLLAVPRTIMKRCRARSWLMRRLKAGEAMSPIYQLPRILVRYSRRRTARASNGKSIVCQTAK